ncbi:MAG: IS200/IS605 family transposase [Balneolaceae bacterium]
MANTYHQVYLQTIFAVKYRKGMIQKEWKKELCAVIGNLINETGCKTIIVNGVEDHIHCFLGLKPSLAISDVMKSVKAKSSKWLNESGKLTHRFSWQSGFGCFSYSHSHINNVYQYIKNQEKHHEKLTFRDEYIKLLQNFEVDFNEEYIFTEFI